MMQSEPTWPIFNFKCSTLNLDTIYDQEMDFSACSFESSVISSNSYVPTMFSDKLFDVEDMDDGIFQFCSAIDEVEAISSQAIEEMCEWINGDDETDLVTMKGDGWSPCVSFEPNSPFSTTDTSSLVLPGDDMEVDDHITLVHLLRAYGEAMENGEKGLAGEIVRSIKEKSSPLGDTMERVAYNLFQSRESQGEDIRNEAKKNLAEAFMVVYQSLPNGKFAHFTANSAILESMPKDAEMIRVVDFDMGEGIQWPPLIEALSRKQTALKITAVRASEEGPGPTSCWPFEDAKKRLLAHARIHGSKLQIEEKSIQELGAELRMKGKGHSREWWAFNCTTGLPHMGRRRPRTSVDLFLKVARELVHDFGGILILGDGEAREDSSSSYASYFDYLLTHYQALFESLERNFPAYLAEARTAMESLFLAPLMNPVSWFQEWDEMRKGGHLVAQEKLEGRKVSPESLAEAKEMVVEGDNSYSVKIQEMSVHEMVLHWKKTPLVRVSTWM